MTTITCLFTCPGPHPLCKLRMRYIFNGRSNAIPVQKRIFTLYTMATSREGMTKKVILWSSMRSLSTAFYRSMTTLRRTKVECFFELFCNPYFLGPPGVRRTSRYDGSWVEAAVTEDIGCNPTYESVMVGSVYSIMTLQYEY